MTPMYSTRGNDAAVCRKADGSLIVIQRGDAGQPYDVVSAPDLLTAIDMANAWQNWRNALARFDAGVSLLPN